MRLALLSLLLLTGCSLTESETPEASGGLLLTDQSAYQTELRTDGRDYIAVSIPYETRNTTGAPLYLIGCITAPQAALEKRVEGEWVYVYSPPSLLCLSAPWVIEPGATRRDTLFVRGYLPGQNIGPTFDTEVTGTYRLNRQLYADLTDESVPLGREMLPTSQRVSNTFELR